MKGIIDAIIAILFILFGLDIGRELIQKEVREALIKRLSEGPGPPPLAPFTRKMTGYGLSESSMLRVEKKNTQK